jgi:bifunctional non-homologous end joining protein LigD
MLAVSWPSIFVDDAWGFELKWDGVRTILTYDGDGVRLRSRAGNDATARYPELGVFAADRPLVLDGEIVAFDESGRPSFERLQQRMNLGSARLVEEARTAVPIRFAVFDVLHDGGPVLEEPWGERRERLAEIKLAAPFVPSHPVDGDPTDLWDFVLQRGIEGVVGKRLDSPYRPGVRSQEWRKIAAFRNMRAVVGGFTLGEGGREGTFGALLLGLWTTGGLRWVGAVGSGFKDGDLRMIRGALDEMRMERSPFLPAEGMPKRIQWVQPQLVAMVRYKEWTSVGRLRAPSFKGFTDDALADVTWEREGPAV